MTGFHCLSPRVFRGDRRERKAVDGPDLYAPGTPDYRRRNRETSALVGSGLLRIDLGDPLPRLPCIPQPVTASAPEDPEPAPPEPMPPNRLGVTTASRPAPHWRSNYGLSKA